MTIGEKNCSLPILNHAMVAEDVKFRKHEILFGSKRALLVGPSNCGKLIYYYQRPNTFIDETLQRHKIL